jgi:hypothetical protein
MEAVSFSETYHKHGVVYLKKGILISASENIKRRRVCVLGSGVGCCAYG